MDSVRRERSEKYKNMEEILQDIQNKLEKMDKRNERIENKMDVIYGEIQEIKSENAKLKEENETLKKKNTEIENQMEIMEKEIRKNKIIVQGIKEMENESDLSIKENIRKMLTEIGMEINMENETREVRRIGKKIQNRDIPRPILIEFASGSKKIEVLKAAKKLKGSDIWISEDYSKQVQEQRKLLVPHMKEARTKGNKAILRHNKLIINDESYTIEQIEKQTDDNQTTRRQRNYGKIGNTREDESKKNGRTVSQRSPANGNEVQENMERSKKSSYSRTNSKN